jgi:predicted ATPase/DNA-binding winged helix-turn-helix (wHTH) protein
MADRWSFGPFTFDARSWQLMCGAAAVAVQPKPLELLKLLLATPGAVVPREDLDAALYPGVTVTPHALRNVVLKLREALGPEHAPWVETVPRKGVRFVGPVSSEVTPIAAATSGLPAERDRFVGRVTELAALGDAVREARIVTLLGLGGAGKTRLALRFAREAAFPGGVWFVDLSEATTTGAVVVAVARALGVPLGAADAAGQVGHALASRGPCLLVLDNVEQVADRAEAFVGAWADRAGEARFLATSRVPLRVPGERLVDLGPLAPDDGAELFLTRARAADQRFASTDAAAVGRLVALVDALPLALELAAARVRVLDLPALEARLSDRFALLTSSAGRPARHAALRVVLDETWSAAAAEERRALARLSVFEGGFALDAAEAVLDAPDAVDLVQSLVDRSLVRADGRRFTLLATVRDYAALRLGELAESQVARDRHTAHFARRAHAGDARLDADLDNLVAACRRAVGDDAGALLRAVWSLVEQRGPFALADALARSAVDDRPDATAEAWLVRVAAATAVGRTEEAWALVPEALGRARGAAPEVVERLHLAATAAALHLGHFEAARDALDAAQAVGLPALEPRALLLGADLERLTGHARSAVAGYEAARTAAQAAGDARVEGLAELGLGITLHYGLGQLPAARARFEAALGSARARGSVRDEARALGYLGSLAHAEGHTRRGAAHLEAALALHRRVGHRVEEAVDTGRLGVLHSDEGRWNEALVQLEAALALNRELGNRREEGVTLDNLGRAWLGLGDLARAESLLTEAGQRHREVTNRRFEGINHGYFAELWLARGDGGRARQALEAALAVHRQLGNTQEEAHTLGRLARLFLDVDPASAVFTAEAGAALLRASGNGRDLAELLGICAEAHLCAGDPREARRALTEATANVDHTDDGALSAQLAALRARC